MRSFPWARGCAAAAVLAVAVHAAGPAPAEETPAGAGAEATPRSAGDLTVEERTRMMQGANAYHRCVYDQAMANVDTDPDIRRIADLALGHCEPELDALRALITGWGVETYFAEGFTRNVRERATHQLLPELAVEKGR
jgi:hypothetical protein